MATSLRRELTDRAFDRIRETMNLNSTSIPVAACVITSLLTIPAGPEGVHDSSAEGIVEDRQEDRRPDTEPGIHFGQRASFRVRDLAEEHALTLNWREIPMARGIGVRRIAQARIPRACMIRGITLETSEPVSESCASLILPRRRELFTDDPHRLAVVGREGLTLPWPTGIPLRAGELIFVDLTLRNFEGISTQEVSATLRICYRADTRFGAVSVRPFSVDVDGGIFHVPQSWDLPPGISERTREISPAVQGRILAVSAELGPFGRQVSLLERDSDEVLWETISPQGQGWFAGGKRLRPGRPYRLRVVHENPTDLLLPGAGRGEIRGIFLPSRKEEWPTL